MARPSRTPTTRAGAPRRNTTRRDRHRRQIARGKPDCALCTEPIDYDADWLHPRSFTIDHIIPLAAGGTDTLDNLQPAHRHCNRTKSDDHDTTEPTWQTWRTW